MTTTLSAAALVRLYRARTTPEFVEVPALTFLCVDGHGDPNTTPAYLDAVRALYAVSYAAKFAVQRTGGERFRVAPVEALWGAEDLSTFVTGDKTDWDWTVMIRQPGSVTTEMVAHLADKVAAEKSLAAASRVRLETFEEGLSAQVLYVGPYAGEGSTIARLHAFIHEHGYSFDGHVDKHHEIYLNDPRRTAPERLRTIIRQPYRAA
jgi:hypothetical protein